ncbi:MAG: pyrroline-5-carboxylate reductase [Caulobacterales bacterium]|nr:pyrroline-5-carboxylate reductase [Caulobacterales bacterium]
MTTPILLLGAGRMGGALLAGWGLAKAFDPAQVMVRDPHPGEEAVASGAVLNPPDAELAKARTVVLAVKPQMWRGVAEAVAPLLAPDAVIVSIAAGVKAADIAEAFGGRAVARVMPTTAVAVRKGTASLYAADPAARAVAHALLDPVATTVDLDDEELLHAATAVSGSSPAYLYAFVEALEAAGVAQGLTPEQSAALVRSTMYGAADLMIASGTDPAELRRQVTSPAGVTFEALKVLMAPEGFPSLTEKACVEAVRRSKELGG